MRSRKRPLLLLFISIFSFVALGCLIYFSSPATAIMLPHTISMLPETVVSFIQIPPLILFFLLLTVFLFSAGSYIFKSKKHGILIAIFVITYLLFRLNNLTHPFFLILLLALFFTLEMLVSNRNGSK
jgi:hypothetical protein